GRVQPMRASGLVELTRRRAGPALHELLTEPCASCIGGRAADPVARAFAALRALRAEAAVAPGKRPAIVCAPAITRALETGPAAAARTAVAERLGFDVAVRPTPGQADFEIVLE
ncbi:MAG TPA: hypothetical protein VLL72_04530, partial [Kiloniellales bacterium]|nr:hypothetical protein [Kiloniellales bacterium]